MGKSEKLASGGEVGHLESGLQMLRPSFLGDVTFADGLCRGMFTDDSVSCLPRLPDISSPYERLSSL